MIFVYFTTVRVNLREPEFQGSADHPNDNGALRNQDIDHELLQRAEEKVDKYRGGYQAHGLRHGFLPVIVSTSGRIHGELLRLLYIRKTARSVQALEEAVDVDFEVFCWRRSEVFWRARKPLPCALRSPAQPALGHERGAPVLKHHLPGLGLCLRLHWMQPYLLRRFSSLFFLLVRAALKFRSLRIHPPRSCCFAVFYSAPGGVGFFK